MLKALRDASMASGLALLVAACGGGEQQQTADANPCAANPCAANPCAMNPCNPCAAGGPIAPEKFQQGDRSLNDGGHSEAELVAMGEELFSDASLSSNNAVSCTTCHTNYGQLAASFAEPYPHEVGMVKNRSGVEEINAAEMVQFCMLAPMQSDPLEWDDVKLAALTAYVEDWQQGFDASMATIQPGANPCNPCAMNPCNPCAMNPCGANPCAGQNPCNPCGANPCAMNPCGANPCAANPCAGNPCAGGGNPCNPCGAGGNPCGGGSGG